MGNRVVMAFYRKRQIDDPRKHISHLARFLIPISNSQSPCAPTDASHLRDGRRRLTDGPDCLNITYVVSFLIPPQKCMLG